MKLLNRNQKTSKEIAKDRLKVVLIHDRANISPEVMQALKNDIIEVISHYMDINKNEMEISLENDDNFLLNIYHLFIRLVFIALLYTSSKKMVQYNIMIIKLSHINEVYINEQIP